MNWERAAIEWLGLAMIGSTALLLAARAALGLVRHPADRLFVASWTLAAAALLPWAALVASRPTFVLRVLPAIAPLDDSVQGAQASLDDGPNASSEDVARGVELAAPRGRTETRPSNAALPTAALSTAASPALRFAWPLGLAFTYSVGLTVALTRMGVGLWASRRLARRSSAPTADVDALWRELAGVVAERVALRIDPRSSTPRLAWWGRPFLVAPARLCRPDEAAGLRFALAHELAHLQNGDLRRWAAVNLACAGLWFHPLAWRLRRETRECQELLADAAAGGEQRVEYAAFLVRAARWLLEDRSDAALAMGGKSSNLTRRITALLAERLNQRRQPHARIALACLLAAIAVPCLAVRFVEAEANARMQADQEETKANSYVTLRVLDAATKLPLAGASVTQVKNQPGLVGLKEVANWGRSNVQGELAIPNPTTQSTHADFRVTRPDYLYEVVTVWANRKSDEVLVEIFPAATITGKVLFESRPVPGAVVVAMSGDLEEFNASHGEQVETDSDGKFAIDIIRGSSAHLLIDTKTSGLHEVQFKEPRGDVGRLEVVQGLTMGGRVAAVDGKPAQGVKVFATPRRPPRQPQVLEAARGLFVRSATTDHEGRFEFPPVAAGEYWVQVSHDADSLERGLFEGQLVDANGDPDADALKAIEIHAIPAQSVEVSVTRAGGLPLSSYGAQSLVVLNSTIGGGLAYTSNAESDRAGVTKVLVPASWPEAQMASVMLTFSRTDLGPREEIYYQAKVNGKVVDESKAWIPEHRTRLTIELKPNEY